MNNNINLESYNENTEEDVDKQIENKIRTFSFLKKDGSKYEMSVLEVGGLDDVYKEINKDLAESEKVEIPKGALEIVDIFKNASIEKSNLKGEKIAKRPHLLIAGGFVRDFLLGKKPKDIDFATNMEPEEVEEGIKKYYLGDDYTALKKEDVEKELKDKGINFKRTGKQFMVSLVRIAEEDYEIATFREEGEYIDGRRPESVEPVMSPGEDASRRDFTINAMYYNPASGKIVDYCGGLKDIKEKKLKFVGKAEDRIKEDSLRMLRFIRFALRTDFSLDQEAIDAIKENADKIKNLSMDRIKEELDKSLKASRVNDFLNILDEVGLLKEILPEIEKLKECEQGAPDHMEGDVFTHTLMAGENLPVNSSFRLKWAMVFHNISKPEARIERDDKVGFLRYDKLGEEKAEKIMSRMRFKTEDIKDIKWLINSHQEFFSKTNGRLLTVSEKRKERAENRTHRYLINLFRERKAKNKDIFLVKDLLEMCMADNLGRLKEGFTPDEGRIESEKENLLMKNVYEKAEKDYKQNPKYKIIEKLKIGKIIIKELPNIKGIMVEKMKKDIEKYLVESNFSKTEEAIEIVKKRILIN